MTFASATFNAFSIKLPLPPGPLLVEASAGTGKTWSIARLVARLLVEDPPEGGEPCELAQILVVTFTNAATGELRDRVRAFFLECQTALAAAIEGTVQRPADLGLAHILGVETESGWCQRPQADLTRRFDRMARAVRDFDTASISTIHGFCQRVLQLLAFESGASFSTELVEDVRPLIEEVVDDWWHRLVVPASLAEYVWFKHKNGAALSRSRLLSIASARLSARNQPVLPMVALDWRQDLARLARLSAPLATRLAGEEGDELLRQIETAVGAKSLSAQRYRLADLANHRASAVRWLESGALPGLAGETSARLFSAASMESAVNKGKTRPQHALLDAIDTVYLQAHPGLSDAVITEFAQYVQVEFAARMRRKNLQGFDDLLDQVRAGLANPPLVQGLRQRYRVALIDEFQDTDATQWEIFRRVFLDDPQARLVLIGDPKQAIYSFRGADVAVYAIARASIPSARRFTMDTNFRSDEPVLHAVETLLGGAPNVFLTPEITFQPVRAQFGLSRLAEAEGQPVPALTVRWFDTTTWNPQAEKPASHSQLEPQFPDQVASDIVRELAAGRTRQLDSGARGLSARDFAVLTHTNRAAAEVHAALLASGVPAVITQSGSVFATSEALWLSAWLAALAGGSERSARAFAVTPLCGWKLPDLFAARAGARPEGPAAQWPTFVERLAKQSERINSMRFWSALGEMLHSPCEPDGVPAMVRVASLPDGERRLTNLRHLGELLHTAALTEHLGVVGLARWLADRRQRDDTESETAQLRLESEADSVQVGTMHKSKGLEYPIVYLPYLWDGRIQRGKNLPQNPIRFHRPQESQVTTDLRGTSGALKADAAAALRELQEDKQRLLYVALTRAMHRVVLYTGPVTGTGGLNLGTSPLGLVFHGRAGPGFDQADYDIPVAAAQRVATLLGNNHDALRADVAEIVARAPSAITLEPVNPLPATTAPDRVEAPASLQAPTSFSRGSLDRLWRRASYSGLVGDRHATVLPAEEPPPVDLEARDHGDREETPANESSGLSSVAVGAAEGLPLHGFPGGAEAGTWVHEVFEEISFSNGEPSPKTEGQTLAELVRERGERNGFPRAEKDALLVAALPKILQTPLGPQVGNLCLGGLADHDRLDELAFDLAIGPGDAWNNHRPVLGSELAAALSAERPGLALPAGYLDQVRAMDFRPLSGFLIGFIDLVFRAKVDGQIRWYVADYKTNTLGRRRAGGGPVVESGPEHYSQAFMAAEIAKKHYYIQYMLYLVALHRFLRSRLPEYDYDRDVGGAVYLFVRGMIGPNTAGDAAGNRHGVFFDKPPKTLIVALSDLFARSEENLP